MALQYRGFNAKLKKLFSHPEPVEGSVQLVASSRRAKHYRLAVDYHKYEGLTALINIMPKTRNLLKNFKLETASATRKCHASSKHKIAKGERHLAVYESGMRQNICKQCFAPMVPVANTHWRDIVQAMR